MVSVFEGLIPSDEPNLEGYFGLVLGELMGRENLLTDWFFQLTEIKKIKKTAPNRFFSNPSNEVRVSSIKTLY